MLLMLTCKGVYVVHLVERVKQVILKMFLKSFATTSVKFYTLGTL